MQGLKFRLENESEVHKFFELIFQGPFSIGSPQSMFLKPTSFAQKALTQLVSFKLGIILRTQYQMLLRYNVCYDKTEG